MMTTKNVLSTTFIIIIGALPLITLTSCGKDETTGGMVGAGTGALLGTAVAGRSSRGEGAVIGALAGGLLGSTIGRESDRESDNAAHSREVNRLNADRERLRQEALRWCSDCGRQVNLANAQTCPSCGGKLIREKHCNACGRTFHYPELLSYRYCPYHSGEKVALNGI